jgi:hypothetical protein
MEEDLKKVVSGKFHNTRSARKPRTSWEDIVQRDALQVLGIRSWRRQAGNVKEGRHPLWMDRPKKGFSAKRGWMNSYSAVNTLRLGYKTRVNDVE